MRRCASFASLVVAVAAAACGAPSYPECNGDHDCRRGRHRRQWCIGRACQQCRTDIDCRPAGSCVFNRCEPLPAQQPAACNSTHACPLPQRCMLGHCLEATAVNAVSSDGGECVFPHVHFACDGDALDETARAALQPTAE